MTNYFDTLSLPLRIQKEYYLDSLLSFHENALVFSMKTKKDNPAFSLVLKIIPKIYFDETLFDVLQSLHQPFFLLPTELFTEKDFVFAIYPRLLSFSEYLTQEKIPFSIILQWIKGIDEIVSCLHENQISHGDISPNNIYMDEQGHFYLGDFSSSRLLSPDFKNYSIFQRKKKKTSATYPPPSSFGEYSQDIYSFLTILSLLLKAPSSLNKEETLALYSLQKEVEKVRSLFRLDNTSPEKTTIAPKKNAKPAFFTWKIGKVFYSITNKKQFHDTFHQICNKILLFIEREQLETIFLKNNFTLSSTEIEFLGETTKPTTITARSSILKKENVSTFLCKKPKTFCWLHTIPVPLLGLIISILVFLSAVVFYGSTDDLLRARKVKTLPSQMITAKSPTATPNMTSANKTFYPSPTHMITSASLTPAPAPGKTILDISHKKYQAVPPTTIKSSPVKVIFAEYNHIKNLSSLSNYTSLEELYLEHNAVTDVSKLTDLKHLTVLGLSYNQIIDVSPLGKITSLTVLDLSYQTYLSNLSSLGSLKKLEYLILTGTNVSDNEIQHLQQALPLCTILH